jgi:YbbR domain-containing protein
VPVQIETVGDPALGYRTRRVVIEPSEVTVSGPTTYVTQVVEAAASISVQGAQADVEDDLRLQPLDEAGEVVSYVDLEPEEVAVRVPVEPSGYYRPLAVKVTLEGEVAPGYRVIDITVEPPTITVFGTPTVLSALQGFIETQPIDVEGAQDNVTVQPALDIPENVSVVPGQQVEVKVFVEPIESSVTMEVVPEVQGVGPDLEATVSPETVEIILSGPLPILNELEPDDVRVVVDLFDLSAGTHQLEPDVFVPEGVTAQSVIPSTLQVEIEDS